MTVLFDFDLQEEALRKRLLHRSRQRGMLEVDLLLGKWASENVILENGDNI